MNTSNLAKQDTVDECNKGGINLLDHMLSLLGECKAVDVVDICLAGKSELADHMIIASGNSKRQVVSISEKIIESLKAVFQINAGVEGKQQGDWVLIDAGDVILHLFRPEVREYYQLEQMWRSETLVQQPE